MLLGALGEDGCDTGDAEFSGFLDGPLEAIEFEDGEQQVDGQGGVGLQLFMEREEDFSFRDSCDLTAVEKAIGYDIVGLTGLGAQDTGEMLGLLAGEGGMRGVAGLRRPCVGDPTAAHKAVKREQGTANNDDYGLGIVTLTGVWLMKSKEMTADLRWSQTAWVMGKVNRTIPDASPPG